MIIYTQIAVSFIIHVYIQVNIFIIIKNRRHHQFVASCLHYINVTDTELLRSAVMFDPESDVFQVFSSRSENPYEIYQMTNDLCNLSIFQWFPKHKFSGKQSCSRANIVHGTPTLQRLLKEQTYRS